VVSSEAIDCTPDPAAPTACETWQLEFTVVSHRLLGRLRERLRLHHNRRRHDRGPPHPRQLHRQRQLHRRGRHLRRDEVPL